MDTPRDHLAKLLLTVLADPAARDLLAIEVEPLAALLDNRQEVLSVLRLASATNHLPEVYDITMSFTGFPRQPATPS